MALEGSSIPASDRAPAVATLSPWNKTRGTRWIPDRPAGRGSET